MSKKKTGISIPELAKNIGVNPNMAYKWVAKNSIATYEERNVKKVKKEIQDMFATYKKIIEKNSNNLLDEGKAKADNKIIELNNIIEEQALKIQKLQETKTTEGEIEKMNKITKEMNEITEKMQNKISQLNKDRKKLAWLLLLSGIVIGILGILELYQSGALSFLRI